MPHLRTEQHHPTERLTVSALDDALNEGLAPTPSTADYVQKLELTPDGKVSGTFMFDHDTVAKAGDGYAAYMRLVQEALGEYVGAEAVMDVGSITFGRHSSGGVTVWLKNCKVKQKLVQDAETRYRLERGIAELWKRRKRKPSSKPTTGRHPVDVQVPIYDPQIGKNTREDLGGTIEIVDRLMWVVDDVLPRTEQMVRAEGGYVRDVYLLLGGDLTEGLCESYDNQLHTIALNVTQQTLVASAFINHLLDAALDMSTGTVHVTGVASNHDAAARGGKKQNQTDDSDDRTLMLVGMLAQNTWRNSWIDERTNIWVPSNPNEAFVPNDQVNIHTLLVHGHKQPGCTGKGGTQQGMLNWWMAQRGSNRPDNAAAAASVMLAGHYHHHYHTHQQGLLLVGAPSLDGGSQWYTQRSSNWSMPGQLILTQDDINGTRQLPMFIRPADRKIAQEKGSVLA